MIPAMPDYEKLGVFYLGKTYDPAKKARRDDLSAGAVEQQIQDLDAELQAELAAAAAASDPATEKLEAVTLRPKKSDITVRRIALVWVPCRGDTPAFG
jgi:hypothetical protein